LPGDEFIWLRNAGNIITAPLSSTMRSLAMACAVKGGREIAIIGHTDCQVGKTTTMQLLDKLKAVGVERHVLPENLNEFFGMFGSERQNVIKGCDIARHSPLIGPKIPVHGLMVDIETGRLEWVVNGYQTFDTAAGKFESTLKKADQTIGAMEELGKFAMGEMKFPETKIGEAITTTHNWLAKAEEVVEAKKAEPPPAQPPTPPRIPMPPPIRMKMGFRKAQR
jgi:carbonic anhydrase